jgi:hypothetical protein
MYVIVYPLQQQVWMQFHIYNVWGKTHVKGDCSMNPSIKADDCQFTHSWIPDVRYVLSNNVVYIVF